MRGLCLPCGLGRSRGSAKKGPYWPAMRSGVEGVPHGFGLKAGEHGNMADSAGNCGTRPAKYGLMGDA